MSSSDGAYLVLDRVTLRSSKVAELFPFFGAHVVFLNGLVLGDIVGAAVGYPLDRAGETFDGMLVRKSVGANT